MYGGWDEKIEGSAWCRKVFVWNPFTKSSVSGKRLFLQHAYLYENEFIETPFHASYVRYYFSEKEYMWILMKE